MQRRAVRSRDLHNVTLRTLRAIAREIMTVAGIAETTSVTCRLQPTKDLIAAPRPRPVLRVTAADGNITKEAKASCKLQPHLWWWPLSYLCPQTARRGSSTR